MTVAITGATGFLGFALIRRLSAMGEQVLAVGGPRVAPSSEISGVRWLPYQKDITATANLIASARPSTVVHCASHYVLQHKVDDIDPIVEANLRFGCLLLGVLADTPTHFVNLSSYFQSQGPGGTKPNSFYAATKQAFADLVKWFGESRTLSTSDIMLFDTYGPSDHRNKLLPRLLRCAAAGKTMAIETPSAEVNLCYISDVVSGITKVMQQRMTGDWAIQAPTNSKIVEIVRLVESVTGRVIVNEWGTTVSQNSIHLDKREPVLGWSPTTSLLEGVQTCWQAQLRTR